MRKVTQALLIMVVVLSMAGCGSQSSMAPTTTNTSPATVPVGMTVTDTPPNGVTVLFFQLNITGATLTTQAGGSVSLLSSTNPIPVNVTQLQTELAFLGSQNVAAGTYTGLSVTFANPQLTIYNGSGAAIGTCANNTVCQLTPTATPLTLSFTSSPFPVTLSANAPLAFKLDIHLDTVIQTDLTVNLGVANGVTLEELMPPASGTPVPHMGRLRGTIQTIGTNQFALQSPEGRSFTIDVNSSTTYNFPSSVCAADAFSCLAAQQVVKVTVTLQTDGTLLASEVDYVQPASQQSVEGNIVALSTSGGTTTMDLIVQREPSASMSNMLSWGHHVRVTVPTSGVTYAVDSGSFTLPSGLTFASIADLEVGQQVLVVVQGTVTTAMSPGSSSGFDPVGPAAALFTTNSITLEPSQITGTVAGVDASALSFTLATRPVFFVPASATMGAPPVWAPVIITVQTTAATTFTNFTTNTIAGLAINDLVSLHGWVFSTPSAATTTTLAADQVLLRPGPMPLF